MRDFRDTTALGVIGDVLRDTGSASLLDIGCGRGALKSRVEAMGCTWFGVDPFGEADGVARAGAEALPFPDANFDAALFLNALHHVPVPLMGAALAEALRVLSGPCSPVLIIEPDVSGDLSEVLKHIDDETEIRTAARAAIDDMVARGACRLQDSFQFLRHETYLGFDDLCARLAAADATRQPAIDAGKEALKATFDALSIPSGDKQQLRQPMTVWILTA